jgi:uncharacterized damage-inducible protein DinB
MKSQEFERFFVMFNKSVQSTNDWIAKTPEDKLDWIPVVTDTLAYGDRVSRPTIKSLYVHLAVVEYTRFRDLQRAEDGATLPIPRNPELTERVNTGNIVANAMELHEENKALLRNFDDAVLEKNVRFVGQTWTGMGLLWVTYGHRAFHLGNIDIYLRQSDVVVPEFHPVTSASMVA